jgi:putative nucleotidyltransferase with HDIG domain
MARYIKEKLSMNLGHPISVEYTTSAALESFRTSAFDIVMVRFGMPDLNSVEFIKGIKKIDPDCVIIVFVEESDAEIPNETYKLSVYGFIAKPINLEKLFFLVRKGIELRFLLTANRRLTQSLQEQNISLQRQNALLAKRMEESTKSLARLYEDLRNTYMRTIKVLAQAIDARDHYTHSHSENVAKYAVVIAEEMGLSVKDTEVLRDACELHDLGKIGIEDRILSKPSSLTPEEFQEIKRHPVTGAQILEPLAFLGGVIDLVRQHHEHYNGSGYPEGLRGEEILLGARIIHVADAYEAMTSARSYRKIPLSREDAIAEIKKNSGTQFDPRVVDAFLKVVFKL